MALDPLEAHTSPQLPREDGELLWLVLSPRTCGWISSLLSAQNGVMLRLLPSLKAAGAVISLLFPAGAPAAFWLPFFSFLIEVSCCLPPGTAVTADHVQPASAGVRELSALTYVSLSIPHPPSPSSGEPGRFQEVKSPCRTCGSFETQQAEWNPILLPLILNLTLSCCFTILEFLCDILWDREAGIFLSSIQSV